MLHRVCSVVIRRLLLALVLVLPVPASAQTSPTDAFNAMGFQQNHNYFSPESFEHYDTVSGNVLLTFTDLSLPGNAGSQLQFQRTYNNLRSVDYGRNSRWSFGFPGVVMRIWERPLPPVGFEFNDDPHLLTDLAPRLITADGAVHSTIFAQRPDTSNSGTVASTTRMVISDQFHKYDRDNHLLYMADGTIAHYIEDGFDPDGRPLLALEWFKDQFDNQVSLAREGATVTITQDLRNGQLRHVTWTLDAGGRVRTMVFDNKEWRYDYQSQTAEFVDMTTVTVPLLGDAWTFTYDTDLKKITTPNGGWIEYRWSDVPVEPVPGDPTYNFTRHFLQFRDTYDRDSTPLGTWELTWGNPMDDPFSWSAEIKTPSGTRASYVHGSLTNTPGRLFSGGFGIAQRSIYTDAYELLERENVQYAAVPIIRYSSSVWFGTPELSQREVTRGTRTYTTQYEYPASTAAFPWNNHRPSRIIENNNEGLGRTTTRTYEHRPTSPSPTEASRYVLGLPKQEDVTVGTETFTRSWQHNDESGFVKQVTDFRKGSVSAIATNYESDAFGNVHTATRGSTSVSYTYDWGVVKDTQTNAYTITREIGSDGTVRSETQANRTTLFDYDDLLRPTLVQPPGVNGTSTTYDNVTGATVTVTRGPSVVTTTLDGFGRPVSTIDSLGVRTSTHYDPEGRVIYRGYPYRGTADIGTTIEYDALDRVRRETNPDNTYRERTYGADTVTLRDEEERLTIQRFVAFGHPDDARLAQVTDALQHTWSYAYNALGNLRSVTAPDGIARTWEYDDHNLLFRETHPESGVTTYDYSVGSTLLRQKTDARGSVFTYTYDENDRLKTIRVGTKTTTVQYEPGSDHRQAVTVTGSGSTTFVYNAAGLVEERKDVIGAYVFFSHYQYDTNGNLSSITYPSQRTIQYTFDSENHVTQVSEPQIGRDYALGMTYHPSGALERYTGGNLLTTVIDHDPQRYWTRSIASGPLQLSYTNYDRVGNVRLITDARNGMDQSFTFDALHRLASATGPGSLVQTFAYDAHGNRQTVPGLPAYTYEPGTLRLSWHGDVLYTYDNNGNVVTAGASTTYTYSPENWLASATVAGGTATFAYDSEGWRMRKNEPGESTFYLRGVANEVLTEWHYSSSATGPRDYIYAGGRLIAAVDRLTALPTSCGGETWPDGTPTSVTIASGGGAGTVVFEGSGCRRASVLVTKTSGNLGCLTIEVRQVVNNQVVGGPFSQCGATAFLEPITLQIGGDYRVTVSAGSGSGTATIQVFDVIDATMPITANDVPVPIELLEPGENAALPFTGSAGQYISALVNVTSGGFGCWDVEVWNTVTNTRVSPAYETCVSTGPGFLPPFQLPSTAAYTLRVNPHGANTGAAVVHLYEVVDVTTPIVADGTPMPIDLTVPGRITRLPFSGSAGQRVSVFVTLSSGGFGCWAIEIWDAANTRVSPAYSTCVSAGPGFLEPFALPSDGNYFVVVNPSTYNTGTATVQLYTVVDVATPITADGTAVPVDLTVPGRITQLPFAGTASQRVSVLVNVTSGGFGCWNVEVWNAATKTSVSPAYQTCVSGGPGFLAPFAVPSDGDYLVVVNPGIYNTGTATVRLYTVVDVSGGLTINGTTVPVTLDPGEIAQLTFAATQGQVVTIRMTANLIGSTAVKLMRPNGTQQATITSSASSFNINSQTLSTAGTYTVIVDPAGSNAGSISVRVTSP